MFWNLPKLTNKKSLRFCKNPSGYLSSLRSLLSFLLSPAFSPFPLCSLAGSRFLFLLSLCSFSTFLSIFSSRRLRQSSRFSIYRSIFVRYWFPSRCNSPWIVFWPVSRFTQPKLIMFHRRDWFPSVAKFDFLRIFISILTCWIRFLRCRCRFSVNRTNRRRTSWRTSRRLWSPSKRSIGAFCINSAARSVWCIYWWQSLGYNCSIATYIGWCSLSSKTRHIRHRSIIPTDPDRIIKLRDSGLDDYNVSWQKCDDFRATDDRTKP